MIDSELQEKILQTKNGAIFYYYRAPVEHKPIIILLHGLTANHTQFSKIIKIFIDSGYGCIAPDLRGHGRSNKTKQKSLYKIPVFVEDLNQIIEHEKLNNVILAGYSFGGIIAQNFAITHPAKVSRLISISAGCVGPLKNWHINFLLPTSKAFLGSLAVLLFWQGRKEYYYYQHDETLTYWRATMLGFLTMPISVDMWMLQEIISANVEKVLHKIRAKTLVIQSKTDPFVSKSEIDIMTREIPDVEIVIARQDTHFIATRTQEETANFILNFLKKL